MVGYSVGDYRQCLATNRTIQEEVDYGITYDLLIKGGMVIDPNEGRHSALDVGITARKIAAVTAQIIQ